MGFKSGFNNYNDSGVTSKDLDEIVERVSKDGYLPF